MSVEAQVAHSGIFDLIVECGGDDSLLVPIDKKDKKHGDSVGIYYSPIINIFWAVSYLLRTTGYRNSGSSGSGIGYQNARAKMELISIDAAIAHHPVVGNRMMNAGPRPAGTPLANWPPPFDEVHNSGQRGGLGNLGLLLRWDMAAIASSAIAASAIASAAIPTAVTTTISTASSDTGAASSSNTADVTVHCSLTLGRG
jgi:hypothetical protein